MSFGLIASYINVQHISSTVRINCTQDDISITTVDFLITSHGCAVSVRVNVDDSNESEPSDTRCSTFRLS